MRTNSYENHLFGFCWFAFVNSCYSVNSVSFLIAEGVDPLRALSADLLVLEWEFESAKETETGCFLKGLRLAVTSGLPVKLH